MLLMPALQMPMQSSEQHQQQQQHEGKEGAIRESRGGGEVRGHGQSEANGVDNGWEGGTSRVLDVAIPKNQAVDGTMHVEPVRPDGPWIRSTRSPSNNTCILRMCSASCGPLTHERIAGPHASSVDHHQWQHQRDDSTVEWTGLIASVVPRLISITLSSSRRGCRFGCLSASPSRCPEALRPTQTPGAQAHAARRHPAPRQYSERDPATPDESRG